MPVKYFANESIDKGINTQFPSTKAVWSTGRNVRFKPGFVYKSPGRSSIQTTPSGLPIREMFRLIGTDGVERTIVCCDTIIYAYDATFASYTDITPSPTPTGGASDVWGFALVAGLPILTNGKDAIWKWASYAGVLTALSGAPTYGKRISSCMHRLVVSNLSEGGYAYTGRIRWTEVGNPENWTMDLTNKSGYFDLMGYETGVEAFQNIKAQQTDGGKMYFFTERGLWVSDLYQAPKPFLIAGKEAEILSPRAACMVDGVLYWIGKTDVFTSTGHSRKPIGLPIRNDLFYNLNKSSGIQASFTFHNRVNREIWFCIPTGSSTVADTAYVYNYELDNWTIVDVDFLCASESDLLTLPYDIVGNRLGEITQLDTGDNGYDAGAATAINGFVETGDLDFKAPDFVKRVSDVIAEVALQTGVNELMIQVGFRNRLSDDIRWSDPAPFTIGVSDSCDFNFFRKDGKYVRLRFSTDQLDSPWSLAGYSIKYETGGTR